jgi:radical SAM superfamily enzyme YgiQ (UPF0313 family)
MAICDEILQRGLDVTFSVNARTDTADEELFRLIKRSGCRQLLVGFESGNQTLLNNMNKRQTVEDARRFMELAHKVKLDVHGCFVFGLPGETQETMEQTTQFALKLGLHTVQFSAAVPFPGTAYFEHCREEGLLRTESWDAWLDKGEQAAVIEYPGLDKASISQAIDNGLKRFYFRPAYMIEFLLRTRGWSDLYRKLRGALNFLSYLWTEKRTT